MSAEIEKLKANKKDRVAYVKEVKFLIKQDKETITSCKAALARYRDALKLTNGELKVIRLLLKELKSKDGQAVAA